MCELRRVAGSAVGETSTGRLFIDELCERINATERGADSDLEPLVYPPEDVAAFIDMYRFGDAAAFNDKHRVVCVLLTLSATCTSFSLVVCGGRWSPVLDRPYTRRVRLMRTERSGRWLW